jgi:hypothetical protein
VIPEKRFRDSCQKLYRYMVRKVNSLTDEMTVLKSHILSSKNFYATVFCIVSSKAIILLYLQNARFALIITLNYSLLAIYSCSEVEI